MIKPLNFKLTKTFKDNFLNLIYKFRKFYNLSSENGLKEIFNEKISFKPVKAKTYLYLEGEKIGFLFYDKIILDENKVEFYMKTLFKVLNIPEIFNSDKYEEFEKIFINGINEVFLYEKDIINNLEIYDSFIKKTRFDWFYISIIMTQEYLYNLGTIYLESKDYDELINQMPLEEKLIYIFLFKIAYLNAEINGLVNEDLDNLGGKQSKLSDVVNEYHSNLNILMHFILTLLNRYGVLNVVFDENDKIFIRNLDDDALRDILEYTIYFIEKETKTKLEVINYTFQFIKQE